MSKAFTKESELPDEPLRAQILATVLRRQGSMVDLGNWMKSNDTYYGAGAVMSTFIGNHDVPRVIHIAEDTPLFGDWDDGKGRAWSNQPGEPANQRPFERLGVAFALLYSTDQVALRERLRTLARIRTAHVALRRGARTVLGGTAEVVTYEMRAPGDTVIVVMNRSDTAQAAVGVPAGSYDELVTQQAVSAPLSAPAPAPAARPSNGCTALRPRATDSR